MTDPNDFMAHLRKLIDQGRSNQVGPAILGYPRVRELVKCIDFEGKNIFFRAIFIQDDAMCIKVLDYLIKAGGDIRHMDNNRQSIVFFATRYQKEAVIKHLMNFDFNFNQLDFFKQTPLFYAAKYNKRINIIQHLLRAGCDVNVKDNNGQTCIFYAASVGNLQMCKLFVDCGANVQHSDNNRQKAINYARRGNHTRIIDYLSNCKVEVRKIKQDRRMQESSQNTAERRRKKQVLKNQYSLIYTNQNGQTKQLSQQQLIKFKQASTQNAKLYKLMIEPDEPVQGLAPVQDKRFQRIALKILSCFWKLQNSYYFYEPVNYIALNLLDYPTIVKYPMDFGTIKRKLTYNGYDNQYQFQGDMNLVFDNCILYNGTERDIGKIALQMKMEFNTMFLKDFSV